jgi:hypothetical protein
VDYSAARHVAQNGILMDETLSRHLSGGKNENLKN